MKEVRMECLRTPYVVLWHPWRGRCPSARTHVHICTDGSVLPPSNFITDAIVRPSHGRPCGHCLTVHPSVRYRPHDNLGFMPPARLGLTALVFLRIWKIRRHGRNVSKVTSNGPYMIVDPLVGWCGKTSARSFSYPHMQILLDFLVCHVIRFHIRTRRSGSKFLLHLYFLSILHTWGVLILLTNYEPLMAPALRGLKAGAISGGTAFFLLYSTLRRWVFASYGVHFWGSAFLCIFCIFVLKFSSFGSNYWYYIKNYKNKKSPT
jgi:hypothetical protein